MPRVITDRERFTMGAAMLNWRMVYNVTQARAARFVGVERSQWARWERGEVFPVNHEASVREVIAVDPHAGRPRQERFYRRKPRAAHAVQRRLFRTPPPPATPRRTRKPADGK